MAGHDVSNEPRTPKGNGPKSGQWTAVNRDAKRSRKSSAVEHKGVVTILRDDGTEEARRGGTKSWRNNNPGNVEAGAFADRMGAVGSDGRFAIFPDEATGQAAMEANINNLSSKTIDDAVASRTPSADPGNNTPRVQQNVRAISKLPGNAVIGKLNPEEKQRLYNAIKRAEGWTPGLVTRGVPLS